MLEIFVPGNTRLAVRLRSRTRIREWAAQRLRERSGRFSSRHHQTGILFDALTPESARVDGAPDFWRSGGQEVPR